MAELCYVVTIASALDSADIIDTIPFSSYDDAVACADKIRQGEYFNVYAQQPIQVYVQDACLLPDGEIEYS